MQIMINSLSKYISNTWIFYEANDPYYAGNVQTIRVEEKRNKKMKYFEVKAKVLTRWDEEIVQLRVNEYGAILDASCTCDKPYHQKGCAHIVNVTRAINELNPQTFPFEVDYQEYARERERKRELALRQRHIRLSMDDAFDFLSEFQNNRINDYFKENALPIRLMLVRENYGYRDEAYFSMKIQVDKSYKVKNIQDLVKGFLEKRIEPFGKINSIYLNEEDLDEYSHKIYDFILKYAQKYEWKKEAYVPEEALDEFYDLSKSLPKSYTEFHCEEKMMKLCVKIEELEDCFQISSDVSQDYLFGNKNLYLVKDRKNIVRYTLDSRGFLARLAKKLDHHDGWMIAKDRFEAFYLQCIQPYLDYLVLETNVDLNKYNHKIEDVRVYSDLEDSNMYVWGEYFEDGEKKYFFQDTNANEIFSMESIIKHYSNKIENNKVLFKGRSDALYRFLDQGLPLLMEQTNVFVSEELMRLKNRRSVNLSVHSYVSNGLLQMKIDSNVDADELVHILNAYRKKKKFYRLKDGQMIDLEGSGLEELDDLTTSLNLTTKDLKKDVIEKPAYQALHLMDVDPKLDVRKDESVQEYVDKIGSMKKENIRVKKKYKEILRTYQLQGIQWLLDLKNMDLNGILADDMGLGKTLQVLVFLENNVQSKRPSLIVCPSSLMYNWMAEIEKFGIDMDAVCVTGNQEERVGIIQSKHELYITTYDYLRRDVEYYIPMKFEYVILDEAQYIKNPKTKNAQSVKSLKSNHRLALTGTPIENSLAELWSIFDFLLPGYLFNLNYFTKNYERPIQMGDEKIQTRLKSLVSPFILRRTKKEVLKDLPDKVEKDLWLDFNPQEKNLYLANLAQVNDELQEQLKLESMDSILILTMLTRLRQICCEPRMLYQNINEMSTKFSMCLDLIETLKENNKKVLLFSSFTSIFDWFIEEFHKRGIKYHMITGSVDKKKRKEEVDAFQSDDSNVFLISLKAGGTGLNLTQAQAVIHYDPWWNVSAQNQATDRAYRIGQTKNVLVYQLLMKNSIEEKIYDLQKRKKEMSDMFVENSKGGISTLSKDEIKDLFSMD